MLDRARAERLVAEAVGPRLELLRLAEGATFRVPGLGIAKLALASRRPAAEVAREADALRALALAGAPVAAPVAGPTPVGDGAGTVLVLADVADDARRDEAAYRAMGEALAAFHATGGALLAAGALDVPAWAPLGWLDARLARVADRLDAGLAAELAARARAAADGLVGAETLLHTDAHAGNFRVARRGGAVLVDTEQLHRGPWRYDLAPMEVGERRYGGDPARWRALVAGYGAATDDPDVARCARLRELLAIGWLAARAVDEPGLLDEARRRLDDVVAGRDTAWVAR